MAAGENSLKEQTIKWWEIGHFWCNVEIVVVINIPEGQNVTAADDWEGTLYVNCY